MRQEVLMAGVGGRGVLLAGELLAHAGVSQYKYVSFFPSYSGFMRGGPCECTVILSDEKIASPILVNSNVVVVIDLSQLKAFEGRVKGGGILLVDSSKLDYDIRRKDIEVYRIPALEMAIKLGGGQASNMILLGAYLNLTKAVPSELIEAEIEKRFKGREDILNLNLRAFREGLKLSRVL